MVACGNRHAIFEKLIFNKAATIPGRRSSALPLRAGWPMSGTIGKSAGGIAESHSAQTFAKLDKLEELNVFKRDVAEIGSLCN